MLTLFTTPKSFHCKNANIQHNAIHSWTLLSPSCEVILFGDEMGTPEVAAEFGVRHVSAVPRRKSGMPLVKGLFEAARDKASHEFLCYVNADIILMSDFMQAFHQVRCHMNRFLMVGQRYNFSVNDPLSFVDDWEVQLRNSVIRSGIHLGYGIDYFVFPRNLWGKIPPGLTVGRQYWDNWPLYEARRRKAPVIDVTPVVMAIHQNHDYSSLLKDSIQASAIQESQNNYNALGGAQNTYTALDATHLLTSQGLKVRCRSCYPICVCRLDTAVINS